MSNASKNDTSYGQICCSDLKQTIGRLPDHSVLGNVVQKTSARRYGVVLGAETGQAARAWHLQLLHRRRQPCIRTGEGPASTKTGPNKPLSDSTPLETKTPWNSELYERMGQSSSFSTKSRSIRWLNVYRGCPSRCATSNRSDTKMANLDSTRPKATGSPDFISIRSISAWLTVSLEVSRRSESTARVYSFFTRRVVVCHCGNNIVWLCRTGS